MQTSNMRLAYHRKFHFLAPPPLQVVHIQHPWPYHTNPTDQMSRPTSTTISLYCLGGVHFCHWTYTT
jgi:hypothetical protein